MDKNKGEITSIRIDKDGICVCIAHGKKKSVKPKNEMMADYDDRPTTYLHFSRSAVDEYKPGDKVKINLVKVEDDLSQEKEE